MIDEAFNFHVVLVFPRNSIAAILPYYDYVFPILICVPIMCLRALIHMLRGRPRHIANFQGSDNAACCWRMHLRLPLNGTY